MKTVEIKNFELYTTGVISIAWKEKDEDITRDLISIIHCFSARIYGLRRSQRIKAKVEEALKEE